MHLVHEERKRGRNEEGKEGERERGGYKHNMYIFDILNSHSLGCKLTCALISISLECILFICTSLNPPSILPPAADDANQVL